MKTREDIEKEIDRLKDELAMLKTQEEFVKRLEVCKLTGAKHKWRLTTFEENIESFPHGGFGSSSPVIERGNSTLTAKMYCPCGASVEYKEGHR